MYKEHLQLAVDEVDVPLTGALAPPVDDRRVDPRYEVDFAISFVGGNNFWVGASQNLSEGGVFIASQHVLPIGTPVSMTFTLPDTDEPIVVTGIVKWLRAGSSTEGASSDWIPFVKAGMGIQFHALDAKAIAAIRVFTRRRSPEFFD